MADGVPQQVHHGVFEGLKHHTVGRHFQTDGAELHLFPFIARQFPHHSPEALEDLFRRHRSHPMNVLLKMFAQVVQRPSAALLEQAKRSRLTRERTQLMAQEVQVATEAGKLRQGPQTTQRYR